MRKKVNENNVHLFSDGTEPGLKQGRAVLSDAANKESEKGEERDLFFFVAGEVSPTYSFNNK